MDDSEVFEKAADHMPSLVTRLEEKDLLYLYARFKQVTVGNCDIGKPSFFDFQGRKKWSAWKDLGDQSKELARAEYISKIQECDPSWDPENTKRFFSGVTVSKVLVENQEDDVGERTKFDLCREGLVEELAKTFESDDLMLLDDDNRTLLHWACDRGQSNIVEFLLEKGIDANAKDADLLTPLHYAVQCGYLNIVKVLLSCGADPKQTDIDGETPMDFADSLELQQLLTAY